MDTIIKASGLCKTYVNSGNRTEAAQDISLDIRIGQSVAITGPSGCGKTTLLNLIGLVIPPSRGRLSIRSVESELLNTKQRARYRNELFGYIVQDFALIEDYTAYENVEIPLIYARQRLGRKERKQRIFSALEKVVLAEKAYCKAMNLSGGQRQRVAIARAIVNNPDILLADEPTGSLDSKNAEGIWALLKQLVASGKTLLLATHNRDLAVQCDREIKLYDGRMVSG